MRDFFHNYDPVYFVSHIDGDCVNARDGKMEGDALILHVTVKAADNAEITINGIPAELLSRYERLLKGKDQGAPVVQIENGCCGNCHMKATLQTMNQLSKGDLESCDNCQHLIFAAD